MSFDCRFFICRNLAPFVEWNRQEGIQLAYLKCEICERSLSDWKGNVMIPKNSFEGEIDDLQIWCKDCTGKLDKEGTGRRYHNLWELSWVKKDRDKIMAGGYADRFSDRVREKMFKLINS